jgi:hypothetical protein
MKFQFLALAKEGLGRCLQNLYVNGWPPAEREILGLLHEMDVTSGKPKQNLDDTPNIDMKRGVRKSDCVHGAVLAGSRMVTFLRDRAFWPML